MKLTIKMVASLLAMIALNLLVLCAIIFIIVSAIMTNNAKKSCEVQESPYCYSIECPCDSNVAPCYGYASRPGPRDGTYYCSSASNTLMNSNGTIAS
jgi:hypothetical protein